MAEIRILSIDGTSMTGGSGYISAGLLQALSSQLKQEGQEQGLLDQVNVFAGTSAGSWNALMLAHSADPTEALDMLTSFWESVWGELSPETAQEVLRFIGASTGHMALVNSTGLRDFFLDFFGADTRLGDLKHKVVVPSFQLDNERPAHRHWKPKIFHNFGGPEEPDLDELVADVAMRSGSPPIFLPIYQSITEQGPGYVDGGLFANNPGMVALAQVVSEVPFAQRVSFIMENVLLFSVSNGKTPDFIDPCTRNGMASWGYVPWMFDVRDPLRLIKLIFQANEDISDYQCACLLGALRYYRFDPNFPEPVTATPDNVADVMASLPEEGNTEEQLRKALKWLTNPNVGWFEKAGPTSKKSTRRKKTT